MIINLRTIPICQNLHLKSSLLRHLFCMNRVLVCVSSIGGNQINSNKKNLWTGLDTRRRLFISIRPWTRNEMATFNYSLGKVLPACLLKLFYTQQIPGQFSSNIKCKWIFLIGRADDQHSFRKRKSNGRRVWIKGPFRQTAKTNCASPRCDNLIPRKLNNEFSLFICQCISSLQVE